MNENHLKTVMAHPYKAADSGVLGIEGAYANRAYALTGMSKDIKDTSYTCG